MKKLPKLSTAILKGIEKFPTQAYGQFVSADGEEACALGGAMDIYNVGFSDYEFADWKLAMDKFKEEYGITLYDANDGVEGYDEKGDVIKTDPIPRDILAGMLKAIGQ